MTAPERRAGMNGFRNWLMSLIAGRGNAYWLSDRAMSELSAMRTIPGEIGAIMLAKAMEQTGATSATISLSGYKITVEAIRVETEGGDRLIDAPSWMGYACGVASV